MHPGDQDHHELLSLEDQEGQAGGDFLAANCPTPHEALSLGWPSDQAQDGEEEEAPTRPATPTQHLQHNEDDERALLALTPPPPPLPSLPPIETAPLGGPLTRSFSNFLHDDSKFFRPVAAAAPVPLRRIVATPLPANAASAAALGAGSRVKRARATPASSKSLATASAPAPAPAPAPAAAAPPPRKKRRGMRPGTYMCLFKGELYECPHGCDIVEKGLLYDLLRR